MTLPRFVFLAALCLVLNKANAEPPTGKTWQLTFSDEFDKSSLDTEKWVVREGKRREGFWDKGGVIQPGDGFLHLRTYFDKGQVNSGSIDSRSRFEQRFGFFEARCQLPSVAGHWSAFWLLARDFGKSSSAEISGAEVDIFEYHTLLGSGVHHAVHWPKYGPSLQSRKQVSPMLDIGGFHVFGLLWERDRYVFYIDGKQTWEVKDGVSAVAHYLLLSNEVGPWAGPIAISALPDEMVCDYVRAYAPLE
jgi:beta-glucanase (GH16 family)